MKQQFKSILFLLAFCMLAGNSMAQVPQRFNYQGIARDSKGNPLANQPLALKLTVLPASDATVAEYEETQLVTTNEFGLYTLQIGNGTAIVGDMALVKWETGNKYIKVAIDAQGGTNYIDAGTTQLLSVPYAIYADKAGVAKSSETTSNHTTRSGTVSSNVTHVVGDVNYMTKFTATNTIGKSLIFDNGSRVGIGTASPLSSGLLHLYSVIGTQPLILESPQGVHNLVRENGLNRGYFGSYIGSGGAYPTPAGTSDADFDIGTSGGNPTGKLHFATLTTPRVTIDPAGNVGVNTTSPVAIFQVNKSTDPIMKITNTATGLTATDGLDISMSGLNANINNREAGNLLFGTGNTERMRIDPLGNVGLGTTLPTYKLDILHGGSTGLRVKSSTGFSIIDLDAQSGDAAIRFANNGVNQWNLRNQPATDNFELFELGGGGSRIIVGNGTGFVGLAVPTPHAPLHLGQDYFDRKIILREAADNNNRFCGFGLKPNVMKYQVDSTSTDHVFYAGSTDTTSNELMRVTGYGFVGIGTSTPAYKTDIVHSGSTGLRVKSTGSFSTIDIDGASGDAALRFAHAGVNQWNVRNRPADDYFEIFELGGGGSRVVIQDGTGNVGIGETTAPSYKLDVLHGGSTGIRCRSSNSFSVIDIDAQSGDAALRFANNGVNQWNLRNQPSTDNFELFELGGGGTRLIVENNTGNLGIGTSTPGARLDVNGQIKIQGGSPADGKVLVSDASGLANWSGAVAFKATGATGGVLLFNSSIDRIMSVELFDESSSYNPATGVFTAPVAGIYHFTYTTEFNGNGGTPSGYVQLSFKVNSTPVTGSYAEMIPPALSSYWTFTHETDLKLTAGDQVIVNLTNYSGNSLSMSSTSSWAQFAGHLVR